MSLQGRDEDSSPSFLLLSTYGIWTCMREMEPTPGKMDLVLGQMGIPTL